MEESNVKKYGLLGKNISYSLSPAMHNAAFEHFDINARYELFDKDEEELDAFLRDLRKGVYVGINVTVPYKMVMHNKIRDIDGSVLTADTPHIGSINTIKYEKGNLHTWNTDVMGFVESVKNDAGYLFDPGGKVFIVGAGGAGRAIAIYLAMKELVEEINVFDIDKQKTGSLTAFVKQYTGKTRINTCCDMKRMRGSDLIVNATPLGTKDRDPSPVPLEMIKKGVTVYDLVYVRETELINKAKKEGVKYANGLGMLVAQGAIAFNLWTGKDLDVVKRVMKEAALKKLGSN